MTVRRRKRPKLSKGLMRRRQHNIAVLMKRLPGSYSNSDIAEFPDNYLGKLANFVDQEAMRAQSPEFYKKK